MTAYLPSLFGGMLIGLSALLLLALNGRVAGVSGIVGRLAQGVNVAVNAGFVAGLLSGPVLYHMFAGGWPAVTVTTPLPLIAIAGLLVGFGTRMGSGCTSGHGVVGLARLSPRAFAAVASFLLAGVLAVTILRGFGL
ncbi:YeeE/YedE family protein [Shinella sp. CPCC 101442]|uniref:YeeE/YedE family protein n=1 Tax=Shinella sp. CPCC 101442 TaxID=2932265 RepID=UPI002152E0B2|nr:YeeE/YedE thiosulfate transporter family protein [Shinella sp. CPCC 101442]MCR6498955.1 YeeE/YedE family protein [Shinella sp. CPCC 101442]